MSTWLTEFRPTRAELSACVQCGLCLPHCPTFRLTGLETASPRGRLAAMNAVASGVMPLDADFEETMSFCLNCRACEAVCPSMVPFGRAMEGSRAEVAAQRPKLARRFRHFVLGTLLPNRRLVALVTRFVYFAQRLRLQRFMPARIRSGFRGLRPIKPAPPAALISRAPGTLGTAGLLAGCVMDPWFGEVNRAAEVLLIRGGYEVVSPPNQTCCGALAAHDGAMPEAARLAARNIRAFAGLDLVVATAAGCSAHLREYGHLGGADLAGNARDVTQTVAELIETGRLPRLDRPRGPVAVQDPCHLRHAQRIMAAPRSILTAAGYTTVEIDPDGICCGAAGIYSLLRPQASAELGRRKADQVRASGARLVASANPGCELQLRSHLGDAYRVAHPIELYLEALTDQEA